MLDLASKDVGGKVLMVSSVDAEHPGENIIDGSIDSYWISTGLYPQEILLQLGRRSPVSGVHLASTSVRQVRIEGSQEDAPVNFQMLAEGVFQSVHGHMQLEQLPCLPQKGGRTAYVRVVILSGWHDFCSVHQIRIETLDTAPQLDDEPLEVTSPGGRGDAPLGNCSAGGDRDSCRVRVRSPGGTSSSICAEPSWTMLDVKRAVQAATGIPHSEQRLVLGTAELSDSSTVALAIPPHAPSGADLTVLRRDPRHAHWLEQVRRDGMALRFLPKELQDDSAVTFAAVKHSGDALQFASPLFQSDREMVIAAVQRRGTAIRWAVEALRGDKHVALAAVWQSGKALQFCSKALRGDSEVVLAAVGQHGSALRWANPKLRASEEVIDVASRTFFFTRQELAELGEDEAEFGEDEDDDVEDEGIDDD